MCLLVNAAMLTSKSMTQEYDQTLLSGFTNPVDAMVATRPIVIIDEPHLFPRGKANYAAIERLKPQMIMRFGATFPIKEYRKIIVNIKIVPQIWMGL